MKKRTLITGAAGYLGYRIAKRLLDETDDALVLWARSAAAAELTERFRGYGDRVLVCGGDLTDPDPFAHVPAAEIQAVIHSAAVTRFGIDRGSAQRINLAGTRKLVQFAARCPRLETFAHLSSIYSTGLEAGSLHERQSSKPHGFANEYERSKWDAEAAVLAGTQPFRRQIFRVATVLCDDDRGQVTQQNVVYQLLKRFMQGSCRFCPVTRPRPPIW